MPAFTKGKWTIKKLLAGWGVFAVNEGSREPVADCLNNEANARLIAKAPAMYELLKDILYDESSSQHMETILRLTAYIEGREVTEEELTEYGFTD